jgi:hypothetical protein
VPWSSSDSIRRCVPSAFDGSAATPASNSTATCVTGAAAERAYTTSMPLRSFARSTSGKSSDFIVPTPGIGSRGVTARGAGAFGGGRVAAASA